MKYCFYNLNLYENRIDDILDILNDDTIKIISDTDSCLYATSPGELKQLEYSNIFTLNKILINLKKENSKNVIFLSADSNVFDNYNILKDLHDIKYDLEIKYYPYIFIHPTSISYFDSKLKERHENNYRIISLNNQSRIMRDLVLNQLYDKPFFCYSKTNDYHSHEICDDIDINHVKFFSGDFLSVNDELLTPYFCFYFLKDNRSKYYGKNTKFLDDDYNENKNIVYDTMAPREYFESNIELIVDCHMTNSIVFSEKIYRPLISKKPFLILSTKHYYQKLQKMGFLLYDEIFDYNFDNKNLKYRFENIVNQCKLLLEMDHEKFYSLIKKTQYKVEYNRNVFLKYYEKYMKNEMIFKSKKIFFKDISEYENLKNAIDFKFINIEGRLQKNNNVTI